MSHNNNSNDINSSNEHSSNEKNINKNINNSIDSSFNTLIQSGLISDNAKAIYAHSSANDRAHNNAHNHTPWFMQLLLGFSGFFAGVSIIGFIAVLLENSIDDTATLVVISLVLLGVSFTLFRADEKSNNTFIGSLAFSISVAGQVFMAIALFDIGLPVSVEVLILMIFQLILGVVIANFAHRIGNFCVALGCSVWLLSHYHAPELAAGGLALVTGIFGLQRYEWLSVMRLDSAALRALMLQICRAMTYASSLMLLGTSMYVISAEYEHNMFVDRHDGFVYHYPLAQGVLILASGYTAYLILRRYGISLRSQAGLIILTALALLGTLSVFVSGLLASSLVIVIAMANRQRILMALGVIALVSYVFWYYYQLDTTLLLKSGSMLAVGLGVLLIRWLLISYYFAQGRLSPTANLSTSVTTDKAKDNA